MSEHDSRRQFAAAIPHRHPIPVENQLACPGTPDQWYVQGWVEHKYLRRWPKRASSPVTIDKHKLKFKRQKEWLAEEWAAGGRCWLVLSVGVGRQKEWLVFSAPRAQLMNTLPKHQMYAMAYWSGLSEDLAREIDSVLDSTVASVDIKEGR